MMADTTVDATRRLIVKKQTLDDAYAAPANFLEIDVINPITHGVAKKRYTDYEVRMRVSVQSHRSSTSLYCYLKNNNFCSVYIFQFPLAAKKLTKITQLIYFQL